MDLNTIKNFLKFKKRTKARTSTFVLPWKFILDGIMIVIVISLAVTIHFIYKNLTDALKSTQDIVVLRSEVAPEIYNIEEFRKVINQLETKQKTPSIIWKEVRNPFQSITTSRTVEEKNEEPNQIPDQLPTP